MMLKDKDITKRSLADPDHGGTDWKRLNSLTDADISASVDADDDVAPILDTSWFEAAAEQLPTKVQLTIRFDQDVVDFFKAQGPKYQTRMNTVLRAFMEHRRRTG